MGSVNERISTVDDGPNTVNERLSPGGPGPEGQRNTACERLSGDTPEAQPEPEVEVEPAKKRASRRS